MTEKVLTLEEYAQKMISIPIDLSFIDKEEVIRELFGDWKPQPIPAWKIPFIRLGAYLGNHLIRIGAKLGGDPDNFWW